MGRIALCRRHSLVSTYFPGVRSFRSWLAAISHEVARERSRSSGPFSHATEKGGATTMQSKTPGSSRSMKPTGSRRGLLTIVGAVVAVSLAWVTAAPALATTYSITDLGNLGYPTARPAGINESGQVAGTSYLAQRVEYNVGCVPRHRP